MVTGCVLRSHEARRKLQKEMRYCTTRKMSCIRSKAVLNGKETIINLVKDSHSSGIFVVFLFNENPPLIYYIGSERTDK